MDESVETSVASPEPKKRKAREPAAQCRRGHEFSEENTGRLTNGTRYCRECNKVDAKARRERLKAKA